MDREELITLHAALGAVLALPDSVRELLVKWLRDLKTQRPRPSSPCDPADTAPGQGAPTQIDLLGEDC
jgi:hypothetical protein